jgi:hypothetical protein
MFGENNHLIQLEMRKRLLVEESELNREQFTHVSLTLKEELCTLTKGAQTLGSVCVSASTLAAGIANLRRHQKPAEAVSQPSWIQILNKGAGLVFTFWRVFQPSSRNRKTG